MWNGSRSRMSWVTSNTRPRRNAANPLSTCGSGRGVRRPLYSLVHDQVRGEAQYGPVALLVRAPAEAKGHEEEPGALQQGHLVVQVKVAETWKRTLVLNEVSAGVFFYF